MPTRRVTSEGEVRACPECDGVQVRRRTGHVTTGAPSPAEAYYCPDCQTTFDQPKIRKSQYDDRDTRKGLAGRLADPDVGPDDVGGAL